MKTRKKYQRFISQFIEKLSSMKYW